MLNIVLESAKGKVIVMNKRTMQILWISVLGSLLTAYFIKPAISSFVEGKVSNNVANATEAI